MKKLLLLLLLLFPFSGFSQHYSYKQVAKISDSILKSVIGDELFKHARPNNKYKCRYWKNGVSSTWVIADSNYSVYPYITPDSIMDIAIPYVIDFKYDKCPSYNRIIVGEIFVILDANLHLRDMVNTSIIPSFVLKNDSCKCISSESALSFIINKYPDRKNKNFEFELAYSPAYRALVWKIINILWIYNHSNGSVNGEYEYWLVNAENSSILYYGTDNLGSDGH